jgi:hypothetical protein
MPDFRLQVKRGTILRNMRISKLEQARRAREAGVNVPPIAEFHFGMRLDPLLFGNFVVLKPMELTSTGKGVQLFRRARVEKLGPHDFPKDHPIFQDSAGYLVQRFVDTGEFVSYNRVLTFLGEPIYAANGAHDKPKPPLDSSDDVLEKAVVALQGGTPKRQWGVADDIMAQARLVGQAFWEIPLLAIDFVRDARSGVPYFLECNPGGNTWHFSSLQPGGMKIRLLLGNEAKHGKRMALELGRREMIEQTKAFDICARALVERTHALAS